MPPPPSSSASKKVVAKPVVSSTTTSRAPPTSTATKSSLATGPAKKSAETPDLSDTYRTPTDDINTKRAEISAVRNELEAFEERLESGGGSGCAAQHHYHGAHDGKKKDSKITYSNSAHPATSISPKSKANGGASTLPRPASVALTEEEREAQTRRQTEINEVRNLPSDSEDNDD